MMSVNWKQLVKNAQNSAIEQISGKQVIDKFLKKCDTLHLDNKQKVKLLQKVIIEAGAAIDRLSDDQDDDDLIEIEKNDDHE